MDQHLLSPLSHAPSRRHLESSWDLVSMGGLGPSMKPWSLLVADARISGISWNSSPLLSTREQQGDGIYARTFVGQDTKMNVYSAPFGHFSKRHPTLSPPNETSVQQVPYSPLHATPGREPQTQVEVKVPHNQFAAKVDSMADRALGTPFPRLHIHTPQFLSWSDHGCDSHTIPMMPLSDDYPCTSTGSKSGATRLNTMSQNESEASGRDSEGGHPVDLNPVASSSSQVFMREDQCTRVDEMTEKPYQCSICRLRFSQRQGLTRHGKDTHLPKNQCAFCENFTWSQGRRYIYRRHLQEEHPGFELPSVSTTPIQGRRRVKLKVCPRLENWVAGQANSGFY